MNNDIIIYQKKLKENINVLINQNRLDEVKEILNYYENIVVDDVDIYSIKGVMAMMEGDIAEAERVLKEGLDKDGENFDLLYNLGYLYQFNAQNNLAIKYFKRAFRYAKNKDDENTVCIMLKELDNTQM